MANYKAIFWHSGNWRGFDYRISPKLYDNSPLWARPLLVGAQLNFVYRATSLAAVDQYAGFAWVELNLQAIDDFYYINNRGELVKEKPELTIIHELGHMKGLTDPVDPTSDSVQNSSSYAFRGPTVDRQNRVATELGYSNNIQAGYHAPAVTLAQWQALGIPLGQSYTEGNQIDNVRFGFYTIAMQPSTANDINHLQRAAEADLIFGFGGDDTIKAGGGNDYVYGGEGKDELEGGDGDDLLDGGAGNDVIVGGAGRDTLSYASSASTAVVTFEGVGAARKVTITVADAGTDESYEMERVKLTPQDDVVLITGRLPDQNLEIDAGGGQGSSDSFDFSLAGKGLTVQVASDGRTTVKELSGAPGTVTLVGFKPDIKGSNEADAITTGLHNSKVEGRGGNDTITGGAGRQTLDGGDANDRLVARGDGDSLIGGDGDDTLVSGPGNDTLDGGGDTDTYVFVDGPGAVRASVQRTATGVVVMDTGSFQPFGTDLLIGVDGIRGTSRDERFELVDSEFDGISIDAGQGHNILVGLRTVDEWTMLADNNGAHTTVVGKFVIEITSYGTRYGAILGFPTLIDFRDILSTDVELYVGPLRQVGTGDFSRGVFHQESETWSTMAYTGPLYMQEAAVRVKSTGEVIYFPISMGGPPALQFADGGQPQWNTAAGTGSNNPLYNGFTIADFARDWSPEGEEIVGGAGNEYFDGGGGADALYGLDGNDTLQGGSGSDTLYGGAGRDAASWLGVVAPLTIDLAAGVVLEAGLTGDTLNSIEDLIGGLGDDSLAGDAQDNSLGGREGNDNLLGRDGADHLNGGLGSDTLNGGAGADTFMLWDSFDSTDANPDVIQDFATGEDTIDLGALGLQHPSYIVIQQSPNGSVLMIDADADSAFETKVLLSTSITAADLSGLAVGVTVIGDISHQTLSGTAFRDALAGGGGNDTITGALGNDSLYGQDGDDLLYGQDGADYAYGGAGLDTLLGGAGADQLLGEDGADQVFGEGGADTLYGGEAADVLWGGADNDTLLGQNGDDQVSGEDGNDTLFGDSVDTSGADVLNGGAGNDTLYGGALGDQLLGGDGGDSLVGEAGDDVLAGGAGADVLTGGAGADRFRFDAAGDSTNAAADLIADFTAGVDLIDLSAVDANTLLAGNQAFVWVSGAFTAAGQARLEYVAAQNRTYVSADVDGDGVADLAFAINGQVGAGDGFVL